MSDELFTYASVAMDSPRLRWMKKHGVQTRHDGDCYIAWVGDLDEAIEHGGADPDEGGYAKASTEDDAILLIANATGLRLWNEEDALESREDLQCCPECGATQMHEQFKDVEVIEIRIRNGLYRVHCTRCGADGPEALRRPDAAKKWNASGTSCTSPA